jgi:hypothetical protein
MAFDITLCFITPVGRMTGFLTAEPLAESREDVTAARDQIQSSIASLTQLTLFTRDTDPIIGAEGTHSAMEITLPGDLIKNSVMVSQIVEVAA